MDARLLHTGDLEIGYRNGGGSPVVVASGLELDLHAGELICLLGPNGSGKSTLIRTLAGMHPSLGGKILLGGQNVGAMNAARRARYMSTVLTDRVTLGNLTVYNMVAFGRTPYTGWLGQLREEDHRKVRWAIGATGLEDFVARDISRLSDGERQKVMIARALAQDTPFILMDEPTAHLDLPNRVEIMQLLRRLAHETDKGILASTHELDLALKAADRVWLMNRDVSLWSGVPEDLVLDGTFEEVFRKESFDFDRSSGSFNIHRSPERELWVSGDPVPLFWTRRALEREGFRVREAKECTQAPLVEARSQGERSYRWTLDDGGGASRCFDSVSGLLEACRQLLSGKESKTR
ncbi:MAG: ABC transporter ATP-binding protein [Balneolaceae bacterium]|nr:ABC transporter ATP-binding protein [Balneolaceae bacterium]